MDGTRIGLSMKDVDQDTGRDLAPRVNLASSANMESPGRGNEPVDAELRAPSSAAEHQRKTTSPERGETQQLTAAGVLKASDFPGLEDHNAALGVDGGMGLGEDLDIELKSEEPPFLIGQPTQSLERLSIRLIKTPDGTMSRAAVSGSVLAKERPELQLQRAARKSTTPSPPAPCTTPRQTHP